MTALLEFERVSFSYKKNTPVLRDLSFRLEDGGFLTVMGESGCGKSTLLSLAAGLLTPTDGRVLCTAKRIACAFQESRLFPWLTVAQNLSAVLPKPDPRAIAEVLWTVELTDSAALYPAELSGGMKSRVSLARALRYGGDLFLLDEPFSALDADLRRRLSDRLRVKWKQAGAAVLLVTHQQEDAERLGGRVLRL